MSLWPYRGRDAAPPPHSSLWAGWRIAHTALALGGISYDEGNPWWTREIRAGHRATFGIQIFEPRFRAARGSRRASIRTSLHRISSARDPRSARDDVELLHDGGSRSAHGHRLPAASL